MRGGIVGRRTRLLEGQGCGKRGRGSCEVGGKMGNGML